MSEELAQIDNINFDNIDKVANVEVTMYAELGRTNLKLSEVVEYDTGSIIPLDKATNSPINVYVDDILIAKAKIVAIDDTYGIKITELIDNKSLEDKNHGENDSI